MKTNSSRTSDTASAVGIVFQLADGTIQSCNIDAEIILGYTAEQLIGTSIFSPPWQTIHENGSPLLIETHPAIASLRTGQACSDAIVGFYQPSGNLVWLSIDTLPLFKADNTIPYGVEVTFRDITKEIKAQITPQSLPKQQSSATQFNQLLTDFLPGIIYVFDVIAEQNVYINSQAYDLLGYTIQDISKMGADFITQVMHPEDLARFPAHLEQLCSYGQGEIRNFEYRMRHRNGEWRWFSSQDRVHNCTADGSVRQILGIARDITQDKQTKQKLFESEQLLRLALSSSHAGSWNWEFATGKITCSPENYDLYGLDPQIESPQYQDWKNQLHPEDRQWVSERVQQVILGQIPEFNCEFRTIHPQGEVRWIWGIANVTLDEKNQPIRLSGINIDITKRKLTEEELHRSQQHLRRVLDSLFTFVAVLNSDGILIEVNRPALEAANLQPEDVLNKPFAQTYWWSYSTQSQARLNEAIELAKTGEAVRYDVEVRLNPETYLAVDFAIAPLFDAHGAVEYIIPSGINITDRKRIETALSSSEQQLRKVLDSLPVYVGLLTPEGRVITINQTALDGVNLKLEDVFNQPFAETPWWTFSTEVQAKINDTIERAAAGEAVRFDTLGRGGGQGSKLLVEFNMIPIFDDEGQVEYIVPSGIDITDRQRSKKALEQSQQELQLITEVIPQQIWTTSPQGEIDYINRRWQDYTGVTLEQIKEYGWSSIIHPQDLQEVNDTWNESIQSGNNYNLEARLRSSDGSYRWFLMRARPLRNEAGEIIKWYGTNTSINQLKKLEVKLQQQTEDLTKANQLKDEFLAIVSHELRTPLNPILGWSQLLFAGKLDSETAVQGISVILRNAKLQAQLIDDLLDVSRMLRGKLNLKQDSLNLEFVIRSALATVQLAAEAKSIEIETVFEPNIGQILGDAGRLQQIVWNLVSNAIKFTPEGGQIAVQLDRVEGYARIQVKDRGIGIKAEFIPYVFERFRQAESSSTRKFGGLGLGLAIVRHLTELHGGKVAVNSAGEGKGATFSVILPLIESPTIKQLDQEQLNNSLELNPLNGIQVLIVDDEVDSLELLIFILEQQGARVTAVASADEAVKAFKKSTPNLIISDIGMPKIDGFSLITQIRALPQAKNIPAIALTAYAGEAERQRSIDVGYQNHISKPVNIDELINTITLLLQPDRSNI